MKKAILALVCVILAPMFLVSVSTSAPYNPWYDLDDDGQIDIFDVVRIASTYGTMGDPGKNVNVTNWPLNFDVTITGYATRNQTIEEVVPVGGDGTAIYITIDTRGYRQITTGFEKVGGADPLAIHIEWMVGDRIWYHEPLSAIALTDKTLKVYDVHGQKMRVYAANPNFIGVSLFVDYYLTA